MRTANRKSDRDKQFISVGEDPASMIKTAESAVFISLFPVQSVQLSFPLQPRESITAQSLI